MCLACTPPQALYLSLTVTAKLSACVCTLKALGLVYRPAN